MKSDAELSIANCQLSILSVAAHHKQAVNKTLQPYLWILISGFAFSWMVTFAALAGKSACWQAVAIVRCAIPLVVVAAWAKLDGAQLVFWGPPVLWLRSIAGSCSLVGTFYVLGVGMPVTDIYTVANIFPIWVALLSWPILGRMPSGVVWLSIVSSIAGVALLQGAELDAGNFNVFIVVGVSLFTAIAMMGLNRLKDIDPRAIVVHFSATALVVAALSLLIFPINEPTDDFTATTLIELIGVGLTAAVGQYFLTRAFTSGEPARMSVATLSQFVFVLILDVLVLDHDLEWRKLWGIPLILGPMVWLMLQRVKTSALAGDSPQEDSDIAVCADSTVSAEQK